MIFFLGKKIPDNLLVSQGLLLIYGIGKNNTEKICRYFGFLKKIKINNLTSNDWLNILNYIRKKNILTEKELKKKIKLNILILLNLRNYRGLRHNLGLSVRGQQTHSNSKTQKKRLNSFFLKRNFTLNILNTKILENSKLGKVFLNNGFLTHEK